MLNAGCPTAPDLVPPWEPLCSPSGLRPAPVSPTPARSARTPSSTSTSTPTGCWRAPRRCGTRTSGWARSPTRTSATCCRWGRGTGCSRTSACPVWVAQRLWTGHAAVRRPAIGVVYLLRTSAGSALPALPFVAGGSGRTGLHALAVRPRVRWRASRPSSCRGPRWPGWSASSCEDCGALQSDQRPESAGPLAPSGDVRPGRRLVGAVNATR